MSSSHVKYMDSSGMEPYTEYKDSGVEWIGEIPEHWDVTKAKHLIKINSGYPFDSTKFNPEKGIPIIRIRDLLKQKIQTYYNGEDVESAYVDDGFILIGMDGDFNVVKWEGGRALLNQRICSVNGTEGIHDNYLYYLISFPLKLINDLAYFTTVKHLSTGDIENINVTTPPLPEQKSISTFLDRETSRIDALVEKKQQFIELLEERRSALISHAVTKGLDPDVPMKDSGVEWIGEIPEHWDFKKLSYMASLKSGENITSTEFEKYGEYPVFGGNGLRGYFSKYTHEGEYVIIGRQGALCGNINYTKGKCWVSEHAIVVNPTTKFVTFWMGELLKAMNLNRYSISAAQPGISVENIKKLKIPVPPLQEQQAIANYLDRETSQIDNLIEKTKQSIEYLKEYRTALISSAVTGKIDVRGTVSD
ncbi:restriction endonuclease subunit S [Methanohalophilus sp. WG1-DM]|uniref:restriction endonuclease subunit S n=1 Tax=Methanohalophilus sp. WG1-DM TaxID=2491675 RepID=UPI000FFE98ED|nr:restriction endonuclease subunit S [Methanohalophilus sp. WG1-DM]RXG35182.1 Uncharacterized protein CI957_206 [Methanohalophilus sp. WG1-DM]